MLDSIYKVLPIDNQYIEEWVLNKHYARRMCSISYGYGLFDKTKDELVGICTFGYPPNYNYNDGKCVFDDYEVLTLELNRLFTIDGLPTNTLSYFVTQALKQLPQPSCIVSYADPNAGHYGYIYQATNWIYTGDSTPKHRYHFKDGTTFDIRRGIDNKIDNHGEVVNVEKLMPTQRYIYFNGNKRDRKQMARHFKMESLPYPKGENRRYDTMYKHKKTTMSSEAGTQVGFDLP